MNIKEAIERGLYPKDEKGRALVPMRDGRTFIVAASDKPPTAYGEDNGNKPRPIVGWNDRGIVDTFPADSQLLLPPPPRKVKVTAWAILTADGGLLIRDSKPAGVAAGIEKLIELTGEYEEPWS